MNDIEHTLYVLDNLFNADEDQISFGEIEVFYESEDGHETSVNYSINEIAELVIRQIKLLKSERNKLINHIERIVDAESNNTYNEPSISVFHRAIDEANEYVGNITGTVGDIEGETK